MAGIAPAVPAAPAPGAPAAPASTAPLPVDTSDAPRLYVNAAIIIAAFITALIALYYVLHTSSLQEDKTHVLSASTVVAILGAVTTFLGTAVGVFFGVNVGQAGQAAAMQSSSASAAAANVASSAAQAATTVASTAAQTASGAAQNAASAAQTATSAQNAVQSTSDQLSDVHDKLRVLANAVPQPVIDTLSDDHKSALMSLRS